MDHPHIAKVLDAGTTEIGRPYFVMELVKGIPITKYCDNNNLSTRERLELFIQVCGAIQHAHQKSVRIITPGLKEIMSLSSHWLQDGCQKPHWCGDMDMNQDSVVNLIDFALLHNCCIEILDD